MSLEQIISQFKHNTTHKVVNKKDAQNIVETLEHYIGWRREVEEELAFVRENKVAYEDRLRDVEHNLERSKELHQGLQNKIQELGKQLFESEQKAFSATTRVDEVYSELEQNKTEFESQIATLQKQLKEENEQFSRKNTELLENIKRLEQLDEQNLAAIERFANEKIELLEKIKEVEQKSNVENAEFATKLERLEKLEQQASAKLEQFANEKSELSAKIEDVEKQFNVDKEQFGQENDELLAKIERLEKLEQQANSDKERFDQEKTELLTKIEGIEKQATIVKELFDQEKAELLLKIEGIEKQFSVEKVQLDQEKTELLTKIEGIEKQFDINKVLFDTEKADLLLKIEGIEKQFSVEKEQFDQEKADLLSKIEQFEKLEEQANVDKAQFDQEKTELLSKIEEAENQKTAISEQFDQEKANLLSKIEEAEKQFKQEKTELLSKIEQFEGAEKQFNIDKVQFKQEKCDLLLNIKEVEKQTNVDKELFYTEKADLLLKIGRLENSDKQNFAINEQFKQEKAELLSKIEEAEKQFNQKEAELLTKVEQVEKQNSVDKQQFDQKEADLLLKIEESEHQLNTAKAQFNQEKTELLGKVKMLEGSLNQSNTAQEIVSRENSELLATIDRLTSEISLLKCRLEDENQSQNGTNNGFDESLRVSRTYLDTSKQSSIMSRDSSTKERPKCQNSLFAAYNKCRLKRFVASNFSEGSSSHLTLSSKVISLVRLLLVSYRNWSFVQNLFENATIVEINDRHYAHVQLPSLSSLHHKKSFIVQQKEIKFSTSVLRVFSRLFHQHNVSLKLFDDPANKGLFTVFNYKDIRFCKVDIQSNNDVQIVQRNSALLTFLPNYTKIGKNSSHVYGNVNCVLISKNCSINKDFLKLWKAQQWPANKLVFDEYFHDLSKIDGFKDVVSESLTDLFVPLGSRNKVSVIDRYFCNNFSKNLKLLKRLFPNLNNLIVTFEHFESSSHLARVITSENELDAKINACLRDFSQEIKVSWCPTIKFFVKFSFMLSRDETLCFKAEHQKALKEVVAERGNVKIAQLNKPLHSRFDWQESDVFVLIEMKTSNAEAEFVFTVDT